MSNHEESDEAGDEDVYTGPLRGYMFEPEATDCAEAAGGDGERPFRQPDPNCQLVSFFLCCP